MSVKEIIFACLAIAVAITCLIGVIAFAQAQARPAPRDSTAFVLYFSDGKTAEYKDVSFRNNHWLVVHDVGGKEYWIRADRVDCVEPVKTAEQP